MPKILEDCVQRLMRKGLPRDRAWAICTARLQKAGILKKGTQELTEKGKKLNNPFRS